MVKGCVVDLLTVVNKGHLGSSLATVPLIHGT